MFKYMRSLVIVAALLTPGACIGAVIGCVLATISVPFFCSFCACLGFNPDLIPPVFDEFKVYFSAWLALMIVCTSIVSVVALQFAWLFKTTQAEHVERIRDVFLGRSKLKTNGLVGGIVAVFLVVAGFVYGLTVH